MYKATVLGFDSADGSIVCIIPQLYGARPTRVDPALARPDDITRIAPVGVSDTVWVYFEGSDDHVPLWNPRVRDAAFDSAYVNVGGDTMTGGLIINSGGLNVYGGQTITTGNLVVSAGSITAQNNITATAGNITATAGTVNATGGSFSGIINTSGVSAGVAYYDRDLGGDYSFIYRSSNVLRFWNSPTGTDKMTLDDSGNLFPAGYVWTTTPGSRFSTTTSASITSTGGGAIQVYQPTAGTDAFIDFHVSGDFAIEFGLAGDINDLAVGGWSMGANKYRIYHAGNLSSQTILPGRIENVGAYSWSGDTDTGLDHPGDGWQRMITNSAATQQWINNGGTHRSEFNAHVWMNNNVFYLRTAADTNHGLFYNGSIDGPQLSGYSVVRLWSVQANSGFDLRSNGDVAINPGKSYLTDSSIVFKENIEDMDPADCLAQVLSMRPVRFDIIGRPQDGRRSGFIAEWTQPIIPEIVSVSTDDSPPSVDYAGSTPFLFGAIKALTERIVALENGVNNG